jgi:hypothetical protein
VINEQVFRCTDLGNAKVATMHDYFVEGIVEDFYFHMFMA